MITQVMYNYENLRNKVQQEYPFLVQFIDGIYLDRFHGSKEILTRFYHSIVAEKYLKKNDGTIDFIKAFSDSCESKPIDNNGKPIYVVFREYIKSNSLLPALAPIIYKGLFYEANNNSNKYYHICDECGIIEKTFINNTDYFFTDKDRAYDFAYFLICIDLMMGKPVVCKIEERGFENGE